MWRTVSGSDDSRAGHHRFLIPANGPVRIHAIQGTITGIRTMRLIICGECCKILSSLQWQVFQAIFSRTDRLDLLLTMIGVKRIFSFHRFASQIDDR